MNKRSFISKHADERSAVATHEQVAQFTVVFWGSFSLDKRQIFIFMFGVLSISK